MKLRHDCAGRLVWYLAFLALAVTQAAPAPRYLTWEDEPEGVLPVGGGAGDTQTAVCAGLHLSSEPPGVAARAAGVGVHVALRAGWGVSPESEREGRFGFSCRRVVYRENVGACELEHWVDCAEADGAIVSARVLSIAAREANGATRIALRGKMAPAVAVDLREIVASLKRRDPGLGEVVSTVVTWPHERPCVRVVSRAGGDTVVHVLDAATGELLSRADNVDPAAWLSLPVVSQDRGSVPASSSGRVAYEPVDSGELPRTVYEVYVPASASWRDVLVPAVVATAQRANGGRPVVLLSATVVPNGEHERLWAQYGAGRIVSVGCTVSPSDGVECVGIPAEDAVQTAVHLARQGWSNSVGVVFVGTNDLPSALCAAPLSTALGAPLLFHDGETLAPVTREVLSELGVTSAYVVGACPAGVRTVLSDAGISVTPLPAAADVSRAIEQLGTAVEYVAVVNPADRAFSLPAKLSLTACALAAFHRGVVLPLTYATEWKLPFTCSTSTTTRPPGAETGEMTFQPWSLDAAAPPLASGYSPTFHALNGVYTHGTLALGPKSVTCYMGASTGGATSCDRVLVDVNLNGEFGPGELLAEGDTFAFSANPVGERLYRVERVGGTGVWASRGYVTLSFQTWKKGVVTVDGTNVPFVVTALPLFTNLGYYNSVQFDLNGDGDYEDVQEHARFSGEPVRIGGRDWAPTIGLEAYRTAGDVKLTFPTKERICADLSTFYETGLAGPPDYLALVGYHNALPFGIVYSSYEDWEDIVTDFCYADYDDDPFADLSIGRVIAQDYSRASLLVARSIIYDDIVDARSDTNFLTMEPTWFMNGTALNRQWENVGYAGQTTRVGDTRWSDTYLCNTLGVHHHDHSWATGWGNGPNYLLDQPLAPCIASSAGCSTAALDMLGSPSTSIINAFFRCGAVGYAGNTRNASNPGLAYFNLVWDSLASAGVPWGEANRIALNHQKMTWLDDGGVPTYSQVACYEAAAFGDPALVPWRGCAPSVASAHVWFTNADETAVCEGPGSWWHDTSIAEGRPCHQYSAPGVFYWLFTDWVCMFARVPIPHALVGIEQTTAVPSPLGWQGHYYVDRRCGREDEALWRVRLKSYNTSTGSVGVETDRVAYTFEYQPTVFIATDPAGRPRLSARNARSGARYTLEGCSNLLSAAWAPVGVVTGMLGETAIDAGGLQMLPDYFVRVRKSAK